MNEISLTRIEDLPKTENKKTNNIKETKKIVKKSMNDSTFLTKEDLLRKLLNKK